LYKQISNLNLNFTFEDTRDAEEALYKLDKQPLFGRELEVEFARGDRKSLFF
jgi:FUS-interacting serine-arginine-rich protein 1